MVTKKEDGDSLKKKKIKDEKQEDTLKPCDKPHVAESTRTRDKDEACDDGVR